MEVTIETRKMHCCILVSVGCTKFNNNSMWKNNPPKSQDGGRVNKPGKISVVLGGRKRACYHWVLMEHTVFFGL